MLAQKLSGRFVCSYQGEVDYDVGGRLYSVRHIALKHSTCAPGMKESERAQVGCVYRRYNSYEFPPPEVCALFPGFVPARYDREQKRWVYQGDPPAVVEDEFGWVAAQKEGGK